jgi:hypothetical protein
MRNTYFVDVDGSLLEHIEDFENITRYRTLPALPGAKEKTAKWHCDGHYIILTTARPESLREITKEQLHNAGIIYDLLIMGIGAGPRILINDYEEGKPHKAWAYNIIRNKEGIKDIP